MSQQSVFGLLRGTIIAQGPGQCCYRISGSTQVIPAGFAANAIVFGMRGIDPTEPRLRAYIERVRLQFTCITAFATPITAGRALALAGISSASPFTGGVNVKPCAKGGNDFASVFDAAAGGQAMISTTTALAGNTVNLTSGRFLTLSLSAAGNAGDVVDHTFDFTGERTAPIDMRSLPLRPNFLGLFTPQAMDAGGTWELVVEVDTNELPRNLSQ